MEWSTFWNLSNKVLIVLIKLLVLYKDMLKLFLLQVMESSFLFLSGACKPKSRYGLFLTTDGIFKRLWKWWKKNKATGRLNTKEHLTVFYNVMWDVSPRAVFPHDTPPHICLALVTIKWNLPGRCTEDVKFKESGRGRMIPTALAMNYCHLSLCLGLVSLVLS